MNRSRVAGVDGDDGKRVVGNESNGGRKSLPKTRVHNNISVSNL